MGFCQREAFSCFIKKDGPFIWFEWISCNSPGILLLPSSPIYCFAECRAEKPKDTYGIRIRCLSVNSPSLMCCCHGSSTQETFLDRKEEYLLWRELESLCQFPEASGWCGRPLLSRGESCLLNVPSAPRQAGGFKRKSSQGRWALVFTINIFNFSGKFILITLIMGPFTLVGYKLDVIVFSSQGCDGNLMRLCGLYLSTLT